MDGTRDLHEDELDAAARKSLSGPSVVAGSLCIFCPREGDYALRGKRICRDCADSIYRLHKPEKIKREAAGHGVRAADHTQLFRRRA